MTAHPGGPVAVRERVEVGGLHCSVTSSWRCCLEPTCWLQTTLLLTSLMHHATWILNINTPSYHNDVSRFCGLYSCISVSYSVARGCSMLNHNLMTVMQSLCTYNCSMFCICTCSGSPHNVMHSSSNYCQCIHLLVSLVGWVYWDSLHTTCHNGGFAYTIKIWDGIVAWE